MFMPQNSDNSIAKWRRWETSDNNDDYEIKDLPMVVWIYFNERLNVDRGIFERIRMALWGGKRLYLIAQYWDAGKEML